MNTAPLSRDEFRATVSKLKTESGEDPQTIDFSVAYSSYLMLTRIFGSVNLEITDRGDRKRLEMRPNFD